MTCSMNGRPMRSRRSCSGPSSSHTGVPSRPTLPSLSGTSSKSALSRAPRPGAPARGVKGLIESAVLAAGEADRELAELQDSMVPVEIGDPELRAGLEQVREQIGGLGSRSRELLRTLGR